MESNIIAPSTAIQILILDSEFATENAYKIHHESDLI